MEYSLFARIAGVEDAPKIPIHIFTALLREFADGRITGAQAKALMDLTDAQVAEVQWLISAIQAAPQKAQFLRVVKDHFYLSEWRETSEHFTDESAFYTKLQAEITDQGGTPPEL